MGLLETLGIKKREDAPAETPTSNSDVLLQALLTGENITRESAMSVPAVAEAVDRIANVIGMLPVRLYQESSDGEDRRKVTEIHGDQRIKILNTDPGDTFDSFQMKKQLATDYLIDRGAWAYIEKKSGQVVSLRHVQPGFIQPFRNQDPIFKTATYQVNGKRYQTFDFITMLRNTNDGVDGISAVSQVRSALGAAVESIAFELGLVRKGGSKKGFLEADKILDDKAMNKLRTAWKKLYSNDEENIVILNNGVKFKEAAVTSAEMQLSERKKQLAAELAGIFHVSDDYEKTIKEGVMPVLNAFEAAMSRNLLTELEKEAGFYFAFDTKEITKGDIKSRYEAYAIATKSGFLTKNEIRYEEDRDPIDGLDIVSMGLGDVLFDTKTNEYYTPNTDATKKMGDSAPAEPFSRSTRSQPIAAGLAVVAEDTGRVLMIQRGQDPEDENSGLWEFPGGHIEADENQLAAAFREWSEEVGRRVPAGKIVGSWKSSDGKYLGFVWSIKAEAIVKFNDSKSITNPDDPDRDTIEAIAWTDPAHIADNPATRPELKNDITLALAAINAGKESKQ